MAVNADSAVQIAGPWSHRSVSANGTRFHIAEAGDGPLVLMLHGFPEFWWTWRHQLEWLPAAGFRAVAVDLRGYGGSDKPPRGYDLVTAASDAAGLVRALGEANAIVVGHGWGGLVAWTLGVYYPKVAARLAVVSMAHPLRLRSALLADPLGQGRRSGYAFGFQLPMYPERQLVKNGAVRRGQLGVSMYTVTPDVAHSLGLPSATGALVSQVVEGSPAAAAGLRKGDVITSVNGQAVKSNSELRNIIGLRQVGDRVDIGLVRDGKPLRVTAVIADTTTDTDKH